MESKLQKKINKLKSEIEIAESQLIANVNSFDAGKVIGIAQEKSTDLISNVASGSSSSLSNGIGIAAKLLLSGSSSKSILGLLKVCYKVFLK